jgi:hypothetical protein
MEYELTPENIDKPIPIETTILKFKNIISKYSVTQTQEMLQELRDAYLISTDNSYILLRNLKLFWNQVESYFSIIQNLLPELLISSIL